MDSVILIGSEDVSRAGQSISSAAINMKQAASSIDESLKLHQRYMEEWIYRFEQAVAKLDEHRPGSR